MYEGHMREGILEAEKEILLPNETPTGKYKFKKRKLLESTSMVHSPLDMNLLLLENDNESNNNNNNNSNNKQKQKQLLKQLKRYPHSENIKTIKCEVKKGEALWLPSFWWHEVQSIPTESNINTNTTNQTIIQNIPLNMNIAINFWFSPLYEKSFPCKSCKKEKFNQIYSKILKQIMKEDLLENKINQIKQSVNG